VQFDYTAVAPDELTLKVGDVITNITPVEDGWCQGTIYGKSGVFPDNFVKVIFIQIMNCEMTNLIVFNNAITDFRCS